MAADCDERRGDMNTCIAVDIGGTKILVAQMREDGSVVHVLRKPTPHVPAEEKLKAIIGQIREYEKIFGWENGIRPDAVSMGYNGLVDPESGKWLAYLPEEKDVPVRDIIKEQLGIRCFLENDVKSSVIAENEYGAGHRTTDITYINAGTGLAVGSIASGRLIRGTDGFAGEAGYIKFFDPRLDADGKAMQREYSGRESDLEMISAGMGLDSGCRALAKDYPDSVLIPLTEGEKPVSGQAVYKAAARGDALAVRLTGNMVSGIGNLINTIICLLSPDIIVLGGGLVRTQEMIDRIKGAVSPHNLRHLERGVTLTELDPDYAGLKGAAAVRFFGESYYGEGKF
jgi:glucokinase